MLGTVAIFWLMQLVLSFFICIFLYLCDLLLFDEHMVILADYFLCIWRSSRYIFIYFKPLLFNYHFLLIMLWILSVLSCSGAEIDSPHIRIITYLSCCLRFQIPFQLCASLCAAECIASCPFKIIRTNEALIWGFHPGISKIFSIRVKIYALSRFSLSWLVFSTVPHFLWFFFLVLASIAFLSKGCCEVMRDRSSSAAGCFLLFLDSSSWNDLIFEHKFSK